MRIILGAAPKGFRLKEAIKSHLVANGNEVLDVGCYDTERFYKFTSIGERVAEALQKGQGDLAISVCWTGTGASIAANKFRGVCAVSCESEETARLSRIVNDANCLCLGEGIVSVELGCRIADAFISARFQDAPDVPGEIRAFWREARDELMARGDEARSRPIETLG